MVHAFRAVCGYQKLVLDHQRAKALPIKWRFQRHNHIRFDDFLIIGGKEWPFLDTNAAANCVTEMTAVVFTKAIPAHGLKHGSMYGTEKIAGPDLLKPGIKRRLKCLEHIKG